MAQRECPTIGAGDTKAFAPGSPRALLGARRRDVDNGNLPIFEYTRATGPHRIWRSSMAISRRARARIKGLIHATEDIFRSVPQNDEEILGSTISRGVSTCSAGLATARH